MCPLWTPPEPQAGCKWYLQGWRIVLKHLQDPGHTEGQVPRSGEEQRCRQAADGDQNLQLQDSGTGLGLGPGSGATWLPLPVPPTHPVPTLSPPSPTRHLLGHSAVTWLAMALGKHWEEREAQDRFLGCLTLCCVQAPNAGSLGLLVVPLCVHAWRNSQNRACSPLSASVQSQWECGSSTAPGVSGWDREIVTSCMQPQGPAGCTEGPLGHAGIELLVGVPSVTTGLVMLSCSCLLVHHEFGPEMPIPWAQLPHPSPKGLTGKGMVPITCSRSPCSTRKGLSC